MLIAASKPDDAQVMREVGLRQCTTPRALAI